VESVILKWEEIMIQVKLTRKSKYGSRNSVVLVTRNIAHGIIDNGDGKIFKPTKRVYNNRMMRGK